MSRQLALLLTTALTAFVLVIGAVLMLQLRNAKPTETEMEAALAGDPLPIVEAAPFTPTIPITVNVPEPATPVMDPAREALYRQQIEEANRRLLQLQSQVQQLQEANQRLVQVQNQQIEQFQTRLQQLQAQNEQLLAQNRQLLERETIYRQRLEEANRLLQQFSAPVAASPQVALGGWPSGPAGQINPGSPGGESYEILEYLHDDDRDDDDHEESEHEDDD